tara:strand:- start:2685 stop:2885 length:201 start_codon:yes stop_codon:yes gene_type:complete
MLSRFLRLAFLARLFGLRFLFWQRLAVFMACIFAETVVTRDFGNNTNVANGQKNVAFRVDIWEKTL